MHKKTIFNIFISLSNLFFLLLYFTLCLNNRLAIDDFHFLSNVNEYGVISGTFMEYNQWSSRWLSVLLTHTILLFNKKMQAGLLVYGLLNLVWFVSAVYLLLKSVLRYINSSTLKTFQSSNKRNYLWLLLNLSIFLVSIIFISTIKINETWFWLCASTTYLLSNIMFIFGFSWLINKSRNVWFTMLGSFSFFYIGGSSGPLAIITLLLLLIIPCFLFLKDISFNIDKKLFIRRSLIGFLFCLSSFLVLYFSPGNRIREQLFEKISVAFSLILNIKMVGIIFIKRLPYVLPFIAVLCLPALSFGLYIGKNKENKFWKKKLIYITLVYLLLVFLFQLTITYKTQDVGAFRALFFITLITVCYILFSYYFIGKNITLKKSWQSYLIMVPFVISSFIFGYQFINQKIITTKYANAYDQRMLCIQQNKDKLRLLDLEPLPPSGMLFSAELSSDTLYFANKHFKSGLQLKVNVRIKQ